VEVAVVEAPPPPPGPVQAPAPAGTGVAGVAAVGGSGQVVAATGFMGASAMAARRVRAVVPAGRL